MILAFFILVIRSICISIIVDLIGHILRVSLLKLEMVMRHRSVSKGLAMRKLS